MDGITRSDCQLVMNEIYEGDVTLFVQRADEFFALMLTSKTVIPLSGIYPTNMIFVLYCPISTEEGSHGRQI
jgi:hypothetical protein